MATWVREDCHGVTLRHTTSRDQGDFAIGSAPNGLEARRQALVGRPWAWLAQVHGARVEVVTAEDLDAIRGRPADALVTAEPEVVLAVQTADCVPITFASHEGVVGVAHAGWRGLESGVVEATVDAMRQLGAEQILPAVGPHIGPECYEFGAEDLDRLADRFGPGVRATTSWGTPGLDLGAAVAVALWEAGVGPEPEPRPVRAVACTACQGDRWFSYRARAEPERMATVIWRERSYQQAMVHP
jgi:YfiH family protein